MILEGLDREELKEIAAQCYASTKVCAKVLFPDRFARPFSPLHDEIFKVLDDDSIQLACIEAPRGWGKTSCVNLAFPARKILFQDTRFLVPISCTATQAVMQGENLKRELLSNRAISLLFGNLKSDTFAKDMWITSTDVAVMPRGSGQQVRGILHGNSRPGLIILDDLEDSESVRSDEQRAKLKEWFFSDVMNSIDRGRKDWRIIVIGTLLHEDSLLANLMEDDNWHHVKIALCDENFKSNWPEFMSDEEVNKLAESLRAQGLIDTFYREYMGLMTAGENKDFSSSMFKYYEEDSEEFLKDVRSLENIVIFDPAKTTKKTSADTAIVGMGLDFQKPRIYVRDIVAGKMHPDNVYDEAINMCDRLGARVLGVEVTSLNEFITYPLKAEIIRRKKNIEVVELQARGDKDDRIRGMRPFYRMGYVYHNKSACNILEGQLISFPHSKRKDIMDAEAYIVEMLEKGERYWIPKDDEGVDPEDEYKDLENEPPMEDWRVV
jgi:hypothetical protein